MQVKHIWFDPEYYLPVQNYTIETHTCTEEELGKFYDVPESRNFYFDIQKDFF